MLVRRSLVDIPTRIPVVLCTSLKKAHRCGDDADRTASGSVGLSVCGISAEARDHGRIAGRIRWMLGGKGRLENPPVDRESLLVWTGDQVLDSERDATYRTWFKAESGLGFETFPRTGSICAHAILQRGDEPTVVLDTHEDWRFEKNPLVTGPPHVRFYAGAPLRTQNGFNVGTLTIMDDVPRQEFSPRQRHTLKEFAAIAMREMELWRDKIQLRIRDRIQTSMEQFTRECLEIDTEVSNETDETAPTGFSMDKVYERAAKLVKKTLDVEGAIVMDVSHGDVLETIGSEGNVSVIVHSAESPVGTRTHVLDAEEYARLYETFMKYPDGRVSEGLVPVPLRTFMPTGIHYALSVPIFNIDKRPFAMLCAYNSSEQGKRFVCDFFKFVKSIQESHLAALICQARGPRVVLSTGDRCHHPVCRAEAKDDLGRQGKEPFHFKAAADATATVHSISHELRTPLHGILAAAELLADTSLNHSQLSFLQTVQACGTSLVETVNHVLDFTKLSGNSKAGGVEHVILPSKVDLMQLVEEAIEGCWIGHRARMSSLNDSEIGSLYSPPRQDRGGVKTPAKHVEIVLEIGEREEGWMVKCEKGGIRRVLMNIFGNSLKFTSDGYVHVVLRRLPSPDLPPNKVKIELAVIDTGKGISQDFLKNQLFHPFSQENPLQTGTGLGLAIVNSIVQSKGVDGKVDVWSAENLGTEIKVTIPIEVAEEEERQPSVMEPLISKGSLTISMLGFDDSHRGIQLLRKVLTHYLVSWWGFQIVPPDSPGHIVIVNEDLTPLVLAIECKDVSRPFIILTMGRGDDQLMTTVNEYERIGGFCRVMYKPGGPSRVKRILKLCLHALKISEQTTADLPQGEASVDHSFHALQDISSADSLTSEINGLSIQGSKTISRRNSDESSPKPPSMPRPRMGPRSITVHPVASWNEILPPVEEDALLPTLSPLSRPRSLSYAHQASSATISVGSGGTLLKSSIGSLEARERVRVLVVEDNSILRNLLIRWLQSKGYEFRDAVDGREGVRLFESEERFDIVLLDLSMPVLDGVGATAEIRGIEAMRSETDHPARILALTGMSSLEDKRRAFEAGVDGYLVKPVAFKTLTEMFTQLGIP
ncbi:hypothetical protein EW146_g955 [Bondarzewia mesenterica]|uniref:histidine kinase n=1 Tax=Bondarzewia mesenterica TaxID=1095465 RepID=A0A4S4M5A3_9AGAM|nr:hypothetical protein EW146_g955 [Bondarzewia mesenterica]